MKKKKQKRIIAKGCGKVLNNRRKKTLKVKAV